MQLQGKVAIITGAARGLGQAFAVRFAREGAKLAICDIGDCGDTVGQVEALGGEVFAVGADVTDEESMRGLERMTAERFGRIDVLVNNAGIFGRVEMKEFATPADQIKVADWDKMMAVNVKGVYLCCKAVIPYMKRQGAISLVLH